MENSPPILAYDAGPRPHFDDGDIIRLTPPSRWPPIVFACLGMTITGMVVLGIGVGLVMSAIEDAASFPSDALCGASALLVACPMFLYCLRVVLRRARFGRDPIWIQLTPEALVIANPSIWGFEPRTFPLADIEHVFVHPAGVSLLRPRIHTIFIDRLLLGSVIIHYTGDAPPAAALEQRLQGAVLAYWKSRT
jgi:hypothetical protein